MVTKVGLTSHALALALAVLILVTCPSISPSVQRKQLNISSVEQIKAEFDVVPCKNEDRLSAAKALFVKMGATAADIVIEKYKSVENLVVRKPGESQEIIVVGAHYDKVSDGCGAIDNWTGIVTLAHLYGTLKDLKSRKTILFVAFGKEEKGLIGSQAMADGIKKDQVAQYCEMVNIDSLGVAAPQVLDNVSSKKLGLFVADTAKELKIPFSHASVTFADADSSSFIGKKIPSVTIHGLSSDWASIIHGPNDQASKVNAVSVYLGYRLILSVVAKLDQSSCEAYR